MIVLPATGSFGVSLGVSVNFVFLYLFELCINVVRLTRASWWASVVWLLSVRPVGLCVCVCFCVCSLRVYFVWMLCVCALYMCFVDALRVYFCVNVLCVCFV